MRFVSKIVFLFIILALISCSTNDKDYTKYVNPFIGTGGGGHTYPGANLPFGMVQLSPDTRRFGQESCGGYYFDDSSIIGFSHTHLSGVGEPEYRDLLFMPIVGNVKLIPGELENPDEGYRSRYNHKSEIAEPGYYKVELDDYKIKVELTSTLRSGFQKYTFPKSDNSHIIIDLAHPSGAEELIIKKTSNTEIVGLRRSHGWAWNQYVYFVAKFSKSFQSFQISVDDEIKKNISEATGTNIKGIVNYSTSENEEIFVKVGISAVSIDGARKNLDAEIPNWDFNKVRELAKDKWNKELSRIDIEDNSENNKIIFYTSMYHAMQSPDIFMNVDNKYRGIDGKVHTANGFINYTVFSLWDTFRGLQPLFTIIDQERTNQFIRSLLAKYDDGGRLPMWALAGNYTDDMLGYHAVPVIADAYIKGIRDYDVEKAFKAMKEISDMDRLGLKYYKELGYIPFDRQGESASKTLEYCYNDWTISQMAKGLRNEKDYLKYNQRAQFYENVFDTSVNFMRGKDIKGNWFTPFNPIKNSAYSEGNAYQYLFAPHDVDGLVNLMGGDKVFASWLDTLFTKASDEEFNIGQYAHGNEPSHHLAYLYNYVGEAWKTQKYVNQILTENYLNEPVGLAGNEDCGQMSAWYILSSMGFYSVSPGQDIYVIGTPLFSKATINLENGNNFAIEAKNISEENIYIQSAKLNGKDYSKSYIKHSDIMNGGTLSFTMENKPNKNWGSAKGDRPYSENGERRSKLPYIKKGEKIFGASTTIELVCETKNSTIRYTLDSSEPNENSEIYKRPIVITESTELKMKSISDGFADSEVSVVILKKSESRKSKNVRDISRGLKFNYYEKFFVTTADLDKVNPKKTGITKNVSLSESEQNEYFGLSFSGFIKVPTSDLYTFYLEANDGAVLFIDESQIIENDGNHAPVTEVGKIALDKGYHQIELKYMQCGGGKKLNLYWSNTDFRKRKIRSKYLFH